MQQRIGNRDATKKRLGSASVPSRTYQEFFDERAVMQECVRSGVHVNSVLRW